MKSLSVMMYIRPHELYRSLTVELSICVLPSFHHSNESYCTIISCGADHCTVQGGPYFLSLWMNP